jgi:4-hydroxybenzoyl-CoA reductase subunit beta
MLRLPPFTYHRPRTVAEAVQIASDHGPDSMYVAGGTDLYPNMKRRTQRPKHVISLTGIAELREKSGDPTAGVTLGAMRTLTEIEFDVQLREHYGALTTAAHSISTPLLRNMGTIGGNLLLDTRCNYYDQTFEWREGVNFCMKCDGSTCWVAPSSPRCWAVQSSDSVPVVTALGAEVTLVGPEGERRIPAADLYQDDGIAYTTKKPGELLTKVHLPAVNGWRASYRKLRRRDTYDFPVLGVGVWLKQDGGGRIEDLHIRIAGAGSHPMRCEPVEELLRGEVPTEERLREASQRAFRPTNAMDNTDHEAAWRKKMAPVFVRRAIEDCLG